jgi:hypothetical protein
MVVEISGVRENPYFGRRRLDKRHAPRIINNEG